MADVSTGKSIVDAYRNWSDDGAAAAAQPSAGASIADAYRTQATDTTPAAPSLVSYAGAENTQSNQTFGLPPSTVAGWRSALEPEPGYVRAGPLPFALRETTPGSGVVDPNSGLAGFRWDWKAPVAAVANPLLDFMEGTGLSDAGDQSPLAGKVSPGGTMFLLGPKMGSPIRSFRHPLETPRRDIQFGGPDSPDSPMYGPPAPPPGGVPGGDGAPGTALTTTPGGRGGAPGEAEPSAQPAGAQVATRAEAALTAEQEAEYGSVANKQWLYKSKIPGEVDNNIYIDGINPTRAQMEQSAVTARETKAQRNLSAEAQQMEEELLAEHNELRKSHFQKVAGSDVTQGAAIRDADNNINTGLEAAFNAGGRVDPSVIMDAIQGERSAPNGKLPAVRSVMKVIEDAMQKDDGTGLEVDPRQVNGVRRVILFLQSKHGIAENPAYGSRDVQAALIRVKEAIDTAMEPAAPGFKEAITQFSEAQRAIGVAEALQKAEPKLYDKNGRMQFLPINRLMNEIIQSLDPRAPLNDWQGMTPRQLAQMKSLHDDLMRVSTAEDLAKARGSDTTPNTLDAIKSAAKGLPGTLVSAALGHLAAGPFGIVAGPVLKAGVESVFSQRAERAATRKMENLLRPDPAKFPTRPNPFLQPPEAP